MDGCVPLRLYPQADSRGRSCLVVKTPLKFRKVTSLRCLIFDKWHVLSICTIWAALDLSLSLMCAIQKPNSHTKSTPSHTHTPLDTKDKCLLKLIARFLVVCIYKPTRGSDVPALRSAPHTPCLLAALRLLPPGEPRRSFGLKWP